MVSLKEGKKKCVVKLLQAGMGAGKLRQPTLFSQLLRQMLGISTLSKVQFQAKNSILRLLK